MLLGEKNGTSSREGEIHGGEYIVDPALRGGVVHILRQDLVDQARAVGAHGVSQGVYLTNDFFIQHEAVQRFFHMGASLFSSEAYYSPNRKFVNKFI